MNLDADSNVVHRHDYTGVDQNADNGQELAQMNAENGNPMECDSRGVCASKDSEEKPQLRGKSSAETAEEQDGDRPVRSSQDSKGTDEPLSSAFGVQVAVASFATLAVLI